MNKLFTKIAALCLGATMAVGVGVAVASNSRAEAVSAADATTKYSLINSTDALEAGKSYIFTSGTSGTVEAIAVTENNNNRKTTSVTISNGIITRGSSIMSFTLGGSTGSWTFFTENYTGTNGYLASAASGSKNYLLVTSTAGTASISFSGDQANIVLGPHTSRNNIKYNPNTNNGSPLFACYSSGQQAVYLWKEVASGPTKLATPTGLDYNNSTQRVVWNAVSNASSYKFSSDNGSSYTSTGTNLYADVSGLTDGTTYNCKVVAVGDGSSYSDSDAASCSFTKTSPASYSSVTVSGGSLVGTDKGDAYIQCSASASGTNIPASPAFSWYVTDTNTYGTTTSVTNKASIDNTGKVTFLDNCTVYVWALAPDGITHNGSGYAATASGLTDPKGSEANPYTCAEARGIATTTPNNTHVTGIIYNVASFNSTYNSITYWISDSGTGSVDDKDGLQIYSGKGLNGAGFSGLSDLSVGSLVVVQGDLKVYNTTTYELDKNSVIKSIKSVSSISVKTAPSKTTYNAGEYFAPAGLVIAVTYSDSTTEDVAYSGNESKFTFAPNTSTALASTDVSVTIGYGGKTTTQAITVIVVPAVISVTVSPSSGSVNIGSTISLTANVEVEGGASQTVNWSSSSDAIATVSNGVVTGVAAGTATITATSTFNNAKSGSATITVVDPTDTKIGTYTLVKDVSSLAAGDWIVITNTTGTYGMGSQNGTNYRNQVDVTLSGSDIVISNSLNTNLKAAKLSVKNSHFEIKTDEGYLYANSGSSNNVASRETNSDANGEWVFTIDSSNGDATCIAQGTNTRKSFRYNSNNTRFSCYAENNTQEDIHIYKKLPAVAAVSVTSNKEVLTSIGDAATLTAKAYSDSGKTKEIAGLTNADFGFESGNTSILTVNASGVVTAIATGETTVTVSRDGFESSITIKVVYLTIDEISGGTSVEAESEGTFTFTWSSNYLKPDTFDVEWTSSNENAFIVDDDGSYIAGNAGETSTITVTVVDSDLNKYVATKVFSTVSTIIDPTHISVTESSGVTAYVGTNVSLHISVLGAGDVPATNQNVVCTSSNNNVLTVTNTGVITPVARGVATVTVVDEHSLCTPVVINVRVRNTVLGDASVIGTFDFTDYTITGKTMIDWYTAGTSAYSSAEFTGTYQASDGGYIRFGSGSGNGAITVSYSDAIVKKVVVSAKLYGSDSQDCGIEGATSTGSFNYEDFANITYTFGSPVSEFEFATNGSKKRLYVESITIYTAQSDISSGVNAQALYSFEESNMHLDDYDENLGYCKDSEHHYYSTAKSAFNALTKDQRDMYTTNAAFAEGWARLSAWAAANGESLNASSQLATAHIVPLANVVDSGNTVAIIAIISMISVTAIGGYFFLRKRKEN